MAVIEDWRGGGAPGAHLKGVHGARGGLDVGEVDEGEHCYGVCVHLAGLLYQPHPLRQAHQPSGMLQEGNRITQGDVKHESAPRICTLHPGLIAWPLGLCILWSECAGSCLRQQWQGAAAVSPAALVWEPVAGMPRAP